MQSSIDAGDGLIKLQVELKVEQCLAVALMVIKFEQVCIVFNRERLETVLSH